MLFCYLKPPHPQPTHTHTKEKKPQKGHVIMQYFFHRHTNCTQNVIKRIEMKMRWKEGWGLFLSKLQHIYFYFLINHCWELASQTATPFTCLIFDVHHLWCDCYNCWGWSSFLVHYLSSLDSHRKFFHLLSMVYCNFFLYSLVMRS